MIGFKLVLELGLAPFLSLANEPSSFYLQLMCNGEQMSDVISFLLLC